MLSGPSDLQFVLLDVLCALCDCVSVCVSVLIEVMNQASPSIQILYEYAFNELPGIFAKAICSMIKEWYRET